MLALYPKRLLRFALLCAALVLCVVFVIVFRRGGNPVVWAFLGLFGAAELLVFSSNAAMQEHSRELNRLYEQLDAEGFVRDYSRHLGQKLPNRDTELMVRMHLSNAYVALGRFDEAKKVLKDYAPGQKKEESRLLSEFAATSNLCYCAEQEGNREEAGRYLDRLHDLKSRLEKIQEGKPENRRMRFSTLLNEQCMKYLETGKADVSVLKDQVQPGNRQLLPRVTTALWIARAYLSEDNKKEAEKLLERIVKLAPHLYPGKEAKALLESMGKSA